MKKVLLVLAVVAVAGASMSAASAAPGCGDGPSSTQLLLLPRVTPAGQTTLFGHIASLSRKHGRWEMRFDPALLLTGVTAEQAALEDTGSPDVPNDSYTLDESHRLLTYVVSPTAKITILTQGLQAVQIGVPELAQILQGKNPTHRALFDRANGLGYWIRVSRKYPSPVLSLDQQYHP
jgi:hypothetical protein